MAMSYVMSMWRKRGDLLKDTLEHEIQEFRLCLELESIYAKIIWENGRKENLVRPEIYV